MVGIMITANESRVGMTVQCSQWDWITLEPRSALVRFPYPLAAGGDIHKHAGLGEPAYIGYGQQPTT